MLTNPQGGSPRRLVTGAKTRAGSSDRLLSSVKFLFPVQFSSQPSPSSLRSNRPPPSPTAPNLGSCLSFLSLASNPASSLPCLGLNLSPSHSLPPCPHCVMYLRWVLPPGAGSAPNSPPDPSVPMEWGCWCSQQPHAPCTDTARLHPLPKGHPVAATAGEILS